MIINESEKKRIKSLYGLITEDAPPSESVLVAYKNPFKYEEYESARRVYSASLVDGDMFYVQFDKELPLKLQDEKEMKGLQTILVGKTINIEDEIYKIISIKSEYLGSKGSYYIRLENSSKYDSNYPYQTLRVKFDTYGKYHPSNTLKYSLQKGDNRKDFSVTGEGLSRLGMEIIKNMDNTKIEYKDLPDENFEIRKIQRQKTDF